MAGRMKPPASESEIQQLRQAHCLHSSSPSSLHGLSLSPPVCKNELDMSETKKGENRGRQDKRKEFNDVNLDVSTCNIINY